MRHPIYVDHRLETHVIPELYLLYLISISGLIQDKLNFSPNSLDLASLVEDWQKKETQKFSILLDSIDWLLIYLVSI